MRSFLEQLKEKARANPKRIVFADTYNFKILKAAEIILKEGIGIPYFIGDRYKMEAKCLEIGVDFTGFEVRDPNYDVNLEDYAREYHILRKSKGMTLENARLIMLKPSYFGAMMVKKNHADGMISGISSETKPFIPAFQIVKTNEEFHRVSGLFLMILPENNNLLFFADCATQIDPDAKNLAEIAIDTAETAKKFGIEPRIAMLSFSTHGSAKHPLVDKVIEATNIVKKKRKDLIIDGEIQLDAAIVPEVAANKCPDSPLKGNANILIFPNINSGNIAYKLVERLANMHAVGPILQGLNKPINDLSRGASIQDIVDVAIITVVEAQNEITNN
jgi:phosphate acetyltransferase